MSPFLIFIARESVSSFWFRWLFSEGLKTLTSKNARCLLFQKPCALISKRASSEELALLVKLLGCQGLKVWLDLNIMAYVLEKGCEQVVHFVMPPIDKSAYHTWHCMINIESLAARTCVIINVATFQFKVLAIPQKIATKAERIVEYNPTSGLLTMLRSDWLSYH